MFVNYGQFLFTLIVDPLLHRENPKLGPRFRLRIAHQLPDFGGTTPIPSKLSYADGKAAAMPGGHPSPLNRPLALSPELGKIAVCGPAVAAVIALVDLDQAVEWVFRRLPQRWRGFYAPSSGRSSPRRRVRMS
jgi:hypothetical protein